MHTDNGIEKFGKTITFHFSLASSLTIGIFWLLSSRIDHSYVGLETLH